MSSTFKKKEKEKKFPLQVSHRISNIEYVFFGMLLKNRATE